jgi:hypothetical protein
MDFPYPVVSFGRDDRAVSHDFHSFLLRLGEGGNTRWIGAAHRLAHDIPADGEFSAVPVLTGR